MSVLTLDGKKINWRNPPAATERVMWHRRDTSGRKVTGSLRTIAHLDHLDRLARKRFGRPITVIQPPYNKGVAASAGTHDFDACLDVWIAGVSGEEQQSFFRANGAGAYYRRPPTFSTHIHYFTLPPREGIHVDDDYRNAGFTVGKYVDGGYSLFGRLVASSQISDYYAHRTALAGHAHDPSWFPADIAATVFDLSAYIKRERAKMPPETLRVALVNVPNKVGREAWIICWQRARANGAIFGLNESFHKAQRDTYESLVKAAGNIKQYGLRITPNPVFWRKDRFKKVSARVIEIHPKNTTAPNAKRWPGFYDARYITEVVLKQRADGKEFAVLNTHLAAEVKVVDQRWLRKVKRQSKKALRDLTRQHEAKGRIVVVMGDMNTEDDFAMPRGFRWLVKGLIDKMGANRPGKGSTFDAPTDHKHGVRATIRL